MLTASREESFKCLYCKEDIPHGDWANKFHLGKYAHFDCYRIKKLFDAGNKWVNDNFVRGK
jgi:hypothetical protein